MATEPERLLLKVQESESWMVDKLIEERIVTILNDADISPKWLGIFENSRFENFVTHSHITAQQFRTLNAANRSIDRLVMAQRLEGRSMKLCMNFKNELWQKLEFWQDKTRQDRKVKAIGKLNFNVAEIEIHESFSQ